MIKFRQKPKACIELSTNAVKICIKKFNMAGSRFSFNSFERKGYYTKTGEGLKNGKLDVDYFKSQVFPAIQDAVSIAATHNISPKDIAVVATAVYREAKNRDEIVDIIESLGLTVNILSPEDEALGAITAFNKTTNLDIKDKYIVSIDLGGGSTEIGISLNGKILHNESFRFGSSLGGNPNIIKLPEFIKNTESSKIIIVANGSTIKKATGISTNEDIHDKKFDLSSLSEINAPACIVYKNIGKQLSVPCIYGNGVGLDVTIVS